MWRNRLIIMALCLYGGVGAGSAAVAAVLPGSIDIDFRDAVWSGCNFQPSCGPFGDITVTPDPTDPGLFWASDDGFGVRGGELDEINYPETLTVDFYVARALTGVWLTDIFLAPDGGSNSEEAIVELFLGGAPVADFVFFGEEVLGVNNGGKFGDFMGTRIVDQVIFRSVNQKNDEYSVAGFVTPVPLPGAMGMMISALAAFGVLGRQARKAAAVSPRLAPQAPAQVRRA